MKKILLCIAIVCVSASLSAQTKNNPFAELGYKKQLTYSSSKGEFEEFHDRADVVEIGSVLFDTKTNQVAGFVDEEKAQTDVASATVAMSIDPLCEKYYWISPYAYCLNNPVKYVDPDGRDIVDSNGKRVIITYNSNGSLSFSKNASADIIRIASALNLTETGKSMLKQADKSSIHVKMNISADSKITTDSEGKTHYQYGGTIQGNYNKKDNYGKSVNPDGTYGIKEASVTIYEGTLNEGIKDGSGLKHEGLTMDQAIGAVAGHEIVHATDKVEINKDIKSEITGKSRGESQEHKPNEIEKKIVEESRRFPK